MTIRTAAAVWIKSLFLLWIAGCSGGEVRERPEQTQQFRYAAPKRSTGRSTITDLRGFATLGLMRLRSTLPRLRGAPDLKLRCNRSTDGIRAHPIFTVFTGSAASAMIRGLFGHFSAERFSAERKRSSLGKQTFVNWPVIDSFSEACGMITKDRYTVCVRRGPCIPSGNTIVLIRSHFDVR